MEPVSAIRECDKAIKLDPTFIRAYERKGKCQMMMKAYSKAKIAFEQGLKIDPANAACKQGMMEATMKIAGVGVSAEDRAEQQKQGMKDPEVQAIL